MIIDFYKSLDQVLGLLRQRGRVIYRALKRQFNPNINPVPAVDILVDFTGIFPVPESFRRWAIILLVPLLPMFRVRGQPRQQR